MKKKIRVTLGLLFLSAWMSVFGQITGSGSTITITGNQTFDDLATWLASNSTFGSATEATISITATITFASGATLKRGTSRRNVIVFGVPGTSYRILSSSFTNTDMGVLDFEGEGTFIFQGRGYIGASAAMIHARIKAENLDLIVSNTTGNSSYIDLFYRSANNRICLHVTEKLRVIYNNNIRASFGLTLDTNYQLGAVEQIVGKEMISTQENPLLNGNNGTIVPPFTFIVTDTSTGKSEIPWARNTAGSWTFNTPKILGDGDVIFKTWAATGATVKNMDLPSTWTGEVKCFQQNGVVYTFTYDFKAPEFDKAGWSIRVWDDTEEYISETLASDGDLGTKDIIWRKHTASGTAEQVITKRANTNIRMRLEGYEDLDLSYAEYNSAIEYLDPITVDANYSNTGTITEISNLDELYDKLRVWLADNLATDSFLSVNGLTMDLDDYNLIVDKTATNVLAVNTTSKTITIKANELDDTDKLNVIETTGTVTTTNGATIDDGILVKDSNFTPSTAYDTSNATYILLKSGFTEADLSGMKGLDGVTFTKVGDKTVYDIGDKGLWIEGTLTIDCAKETITSKRADLGLRIRSTGSLTSNCFIDDGTDRLYLEEKIFSTTIPSGTANGRFYLDSGATLNMNGGWIETRSVSSPESNTTINGTITYGVFGSYESNGDTAENQFRVHTNDWNITGTLVLIKMGFTVRQVQTIDINAIEARFSANAFFVSGSSPSVDVVFENVSILGDGDISRLWSNKRIIFPNAEKGTDYSVAPNSLNHGSSVGLVEFRKKVSPTIKDTSGSGIENVLVYVPYVDDGNRVDGNGHTYTTLESVSASTNSSGQLATPLEVILGAYNETTYDATPDIFYMGKNGDNTDIFTFYFATYDKLIAQTDRELKGLNDLEFEWTLIDDLNITESTKATVDAYTEIDNLDKLYDRAKSWKVDSANIEHPSIGALLATADGATLDLDDHDLVIDASAASAFAVDKTNKKITIKASALATGTRFTGIKTTGTISTANSATIEFGYEDSTGINKFVHLDWGQSIIEHVSVINLDNNNAIIDNVSATQTFKDHFVMPSPAPTNGIRVEIKTPGGFRVFEEGFPEADLNFIRLNVTLNASEERQGEMLFLARKLLQKSEGISEAVNGTTPTTNYSITTTTTGAAATNENQVAILQLLRRIMLKVSANKEALQKE